MSKIRIGIVGYGNIGRGVEQAIKRNEDMELAAVLQEEILRLSKLRLRVRK